MTSNRLQTFPSTVIQPQSFFRHAFLFFFCGIGLIARVFPFLTVQQLLNLSKATLHSPSTKVALCLLHHDHGGDHSSWQGFGFFFKFDQEDPNISSCEKGDKVRMQPFPVCNLYFMVCF